MKLYFWSVVLLLAAVQFATAKRIDVAHGLDIANMTIAELIDTYLPTLDLSKPLYKLGEVVNKGSQALSPKLEKAGNITTRAGIALINVGSLLTISSRALSKDGEIGGNPNFIN